MTQNDLIPGQLYRVTRDVMNPTPDRRIKYGTLPHRPVIERGTLVRAREIHNAMERELREAGREVPRLFTLRGVTYGGDVGRGTGELFTLLLDALEPAEETVATLTEDRGEMYPRAVLAWMIANGHLTTARMRAIMDELDSYCDADGNDNTPAPIMAQLTTARREG